jgi:hypothetical protein
MDTEPVDTAEAPDGAVTGDLPVNDTARDARVDAARDGGMDTALAPDVARDAGMDTLVVPDVVRDTGMDTAVAPDTARDGAVDTLVVPDVALDSARDTAPEVSLDVAPDAPDGASSLFCTPPTVDGVVGADWSDATSVQVRNTTVTGWGVGLNELRSLRVCYSAAGLHLGLEGVVEDANAIVVYLDLDLPLPPAAPTGVLVFSDLADTSGALDRRVTAAYTLTGMAAGVFGLDAAWGTVGMTSLAAGATTENVGLRLVAPGGRRADFAWTAGASSVCAAGRGCEVSLAWSGLYGSSTPTARALGLFVRINASDGTMTSNQTLPMDDPAAPRAIGRFLRVDLRF